MKFTIDKKELFSIPNCLSYIRLMLLPCFIYIYLHAQSNADYMVASAIILISGLTDFADGFIARKFNMITELGKALDPFADKCTQIAIAFCLMFRYPFMIALFLLLFVKDGFIAICSYRLLKKDRKLDGAKWAGKVATAVFYVSMVILIMFPSLDMILVNLLIALSIFFMAVAFVSYTKIFMEMFHEVNQHE